NEYAHGRPGEAPHELEELQHRRVSNDDRIVRRVWGLRGIGAWRSRQRVESRRGILAKARRPPMNDEHDRPDLDDVSGRHLGDLARCEPAAPDAHAVYGADVLDTNGRAQVELGMPA